MRDCVDDDGSGGSQGDGVPSELLLRLLLNPFDRSGDDWRDRTARRFTPPPPPPPPPLLLRLFMPPLPSPLPLLPPLFANCGKRERASADAEDENEDELEEEEVETVSALLCRGE
jgi:hypothetical protein